MTFTCSLWNMGSMDYLWKFGSFRQILDAICFNQPDVLILMHLQAIYHYIFNKRQYYFLPWLEVSYLLTFRDIFFAVLYFCLCEAICRILNISQKSVCIQNVRFGQPNNPIMVKTVDSFNNWYKNHRI